MIVRWPRVVQNNGGLTRQIGSVMDVLPTCLDVAGAAYPQTFQGRHLEPLVGSSLLPILRKKKRKPASALFWYVGGRAVRMAKWKLVSADERSPWELYDLERDGTETEDLASQHPLRVQTMADAYRSWAERVGILDRAFPQQREENKARKP